MKVINSYIFYIGLFLFLFMFLAALQTRAFPRINIQHWMDTIRQ